MKVYVEAPVDNFNTTPTIKYALIDSDTEQVEWVKTFLEDGRWKVTGYNIIKKEIYNG